MHVRFPRDGGTAGTRPGVKWYAARKRLGTTALEASIAMIDKYEGLFDMSYPLPKYGKFCFLSYLIGDKMVSH